MWVGSTVHKLVSDDKRKNNRTPPKGAREGHQSSRSRARIHEEQAKTSKGSGPGSPPNTLAPALRRRGQLKPTSQFELLLPWPNFKCNYFLHCVCAMYVHVCIHVQMCVGTHVQVCICRLFIEAQFHNELEAWKFLLVYPARSPQASVSSPHKRTFQNQQTQGPNRNLQITSKLMLRCHWC